MLASIADGYAILWKNENYYENLYNAELAKTSVTRVAITLNM